MSTNNQDPITQNSGGASEWLKQISLTAGPIKSITHIWLVTRHHAWNFCARFSDVILRGNQWWPTSSPGRFSLALEVGGKKVAVVASRNVGCFRWLSTKVLLTDKHLLISPKQRIVSLFIPRNKVVCAVS